MAEIYIRQRERAKSTVYGHRNVSKNGTDKVHSILAHMGRALNHRDNYQFINGMYGKNV